MKIEFIPSSKEAEIIVPKPKPAKVYIPDWYVNESKKNEFPTSNGVMEDPNGFKRCMPFIDGLTAGYIQESWTDIYIKKTSNDHLEYNFPLGPTIMDAREYKSVNIGPMYHQVELLWKIHWLPKMPKGWSVLITSPLNRLDLPFRSLSGIIDSDLYHHFGTSGGNFPFFLEKGFEGIIPAGTPMYQIIPFKRDKWESFAGKYDEIDHLKKSASIRKYFINGYKKMFWQKKHIINSHKFGRYIGNAIISPI